MMSAFGVEHGWFSKAREYKRDAKGKFATTAGSKKQKGLSDEEFDQEMESITDDMDQLYKAEGNDKSWNHWREQLEAAGDYLDSVNEGHAADDVWMAIEHSRDSHEDIRAGRRSLDKAGTRFLNSVGQEVTRTGEFVAPARPRKNVSKAAGSPKLTHEKNMKRDLRQRKKFAQRYQPGEAQKVRTKHLMQVQYRINPTKEEKIKALKPDLKRNGQVEPVGVGISRSDPNRTYLFDGHHRVNAQHRLHRRYTIADVEDNEQHHTWKSKKHPMPGVWPDEQVKKSFKKLGPNLRVSRQMIAQKHFADDVTMGEKMRYHYLTQRNIAGRAGRKQKALGAERKDISRRFVDTISGQNRKNRVLP